MEEFWILILVAFYAINSLDKAESVKVKLEETPLKTFDELFGEGWWDKDEAEDLKSPPTNFEQNVHHQIDRQNTQIGQIKTNSTDQNPDLTESDHAGQIEPNSTDQHAPLTESDHSDNATNEKFDQMKAELTRAGFKNSYHHEIDKTVAKELGLGLATIYNWKRELGQTMPNYSYDEKLKIVKKLMQMKSEHSGWWDKSEAAEDLKKPAPRNFGQNVHHQIDRQNTQLGQIELNSTDQLGQIEPNSTDQLGQIEPNSTISLDKLNPILLIRILLFYNWKRKLGQTTANKYAHDKQKELLMKRYYEIKGNNPKSRDVDIIKILNIGIDTLVRWKRHLNDSNFVQFLSMGILWKIMTAQMFRKLGTRIRGVFEW
uniref:Uncharacterized protein n=1 Tax=Globodera rostochiensis TaxID=31243 RepID=A0A914HLW8_GLORO